MPEKLTPEEKLLKIIENPSKETQDAKIKRSLRKFSFNLFSFRQLKANVKRLETAKEKFKPFLVNLKFVNQALAVIAIILVLFLLFDFLTGRPNLNNVYVYAREASGASPVIKSVPLKNPVNLSDFQNLIDKRDILHFTPLKKEEKIVQTKDVLMTEIAQLKLVGIIWSKNPQAMIEDKRENKTSLVSEGDAVGKLKVKKILRDKVVVGFENEEYELL